MFKITSMAKHKAHNTGWMPKKLENTISQSWSFGHNRQWADPSKGDVCVFYNEPITALFGCLMIGLHLVTGLLTLVQTTC
jgi:hypothetical protein